tara:strand:+ start:1309 stop:1689 length:381 start_codon:yes stop_codon:yes gene_type:complete
MALPSFEHGSVTNFTFEKERSLPISEPINPSQNIGVAGGGQVKVVNYGDAEQLRQVVVNNISKTNRDALLTFLQNSNINYSLGTFIFRDENNSTHTVRLWNAKGLNFPAVKGGLYNVKLTLRDEIT